MLEERNILYFTPFHFENGTSKTKFFLVLKSISGNSILATLPTSKDFIPKVYENHINCIEDSEINFNCFVIPK